jgi:hypothetical protein
MATVAGKGPVRALERKQHLPAGNVPDWIGENGSFHDSKQSAVGREAQAKDACLAGQAAGLLAGLAVPKNDLGPVRAAGGDEVLAVRRKHHGPTVAQP